MSRDSGLNHVSICFNVPTGSSSLLAYNESSFSFSSLSLFLKDAKAATGAAAATTGAAIDEDEET